MKKKTANVRFEGPVGGTLEEIADEIRGILEKRARVLDGLGLTAERQEMGPHPGAWWRGGPRIVVSIGRSDRPGREDRRLVKRSDAEAYLRLLRESPGNYGKIVEHVRAYGKRGDGA